MRPIPLSKARLITGWMTRPELRWLRRMALGLQRGSVFVECGVLRGRSTVALAVPNIRLICVDTFLGTPEGITGRMAKVENLSASFSANMERLGLRPEMMVMDSVEAAGYFPDYSIAGFFLDTDHVRFSREFYAWLPKVAPGGIRSGHDYGIRWPAIARTLNASGYPYKVASGTKIWYSTDMEV